MRIDSPTIIQTSGVRTMSCGACGTISRHHVRPAAHLLTCSKCHKVRVIGNLIFEVPSGGARGRMPVDIAIARELTAEAMSEECSPAPRARVGAELSIDAGVWRSREPVNVELPTINAFSELWQERSTGELWLACQVAFGSRVLAYPLDSVGVFGSLRIEGRREWASACERIG